MSYLRPNSWQVAETESEAEPDSYPSTFLMCKKREQTCRATLSNLRAILTISGISVHISGTDWSPEPKILLSLIWDNETRMASVFLTPLCMATIGESKVPTFTQGTSPENPGV
jgi:hypothetical protein